MNAQQRKYAQERIGELTTLKVAAIKAANTTPAKLLSDEDKLKLVKAGTVKIKDDLSADNFGSGRYNYISSFFDFSKHEKAAVYNEAKAKPLIEKVVKAAQFAKDEIMLGQEYEALAAIKAFEKL